VREDLIGVRELLLGGLSVFRKRALTIVPLTFLSLTPAAFFLAPFAVVEFIVESEMGILFEIPVITVLALPVLLAAVILPILLGMGGLLAGGLALTYAVADEDTGIGGAIAKALKNLGPFAWFSAWKEFQIFAGSLLYFPGIVFQVWYAFAPFVFVLEGQRGINALARSRHYVEGRWSEVFKRLFAVSLAPAVVLLVVLPAALMTVMFFVPLLWSFLAILGLAADEMAFPPVLPLLSGYPIGIFLIFLLMVGFFLPYDMICKCMLYKNLRVLEENVSQK
jgi:hypothetical protein